MADENTIKGKVLRDFRDAGTEKRFEGGKVYAFGEGAFANYQHAGLVAHDDDAGDVAVPLPALAPAGEAND